MKNIAIILAGGTGQRLGDTIPKQFLKVAGKKVIEHTLDVFQNHQQIDEIADVSNPNFLNDVDAIVMVYAPEEVRISRAGWRDASSRELIEKRIRSQMDDEEKRKYADFVIVNDGEIPLIPQVLELFVSLSEKLLYL